MKRFLAVLLCCCLLFAVPTALAAPTEAEEEVIENAEEAPVEE